MGYTTFTGPIRAGNILDTSGNTPGRTLKNVGNVVMVQSAAVVEDGDVFTTISIPALSQILSIELRATVAFTTNVSIGNSWDGTTVNDAEYFTDVAAITPAIGLTTFVTTTALQNNHWLNIGEPDSQIVVAGGTTGGEGILTVTYLQGPNGNT